MRHHNTKRKFGRDKNQRKALLSSLALNLIVRGKIKTTEPKAKELRPFVEGLVTESKKNTVASRRIVTSRLGSAEAVQKLHTDIAVRFAARAGGYTRIVRLGRVGTRVAEMARIEFVA